MRLARLTCEDFRNFSRIDVRLEGRTALIYGGNAQGKTNFLEAVYFLAALRSFRGAKKEALIAFDRPQASIIGTVEDSAGEFKLAVTIDANRRRQAVDGKETVPSDFIGRLPAVAFAPSDLLLVSGSPEQRRKFLDRAIFSTRPHYLKELRDFQRTLRGRNALLRDRRFRGEHVMDAWDEKLASSSARLAVERRRYVKLLGERIGGPYNRMSGGGEEVGCSYATCCDELLHSDEQGCVEAIRSLLKTNRARDLERGSTTAGVHRDDLELLLDGRPMCDTASQGQRRSATLALKSCEVSICTEHNGAGPLFLLDDVTSELDVKRRKNLLDFLIEIPAQVLLTTTEAGQIDLSARGAVQILHVSAGQVA